MNDAEKLRMKLIAQNDQLLTHYKNYIIEYMDLNQKNFAAMSDLIKKVTKQQLDEDIEPYSEKDIINSLIFIGYLSTIVETKPLQEETKNE